MVNLRSLLLVETELTKLGLQSVDIRMGEADVLEDPTAGQRLELRNALRRFGLELLERKNDILIHRIRRIIIDLVHSDEWPEQNFSAYLTERLEYDYTYMSNLFSDVTKTTIEKFYIAHKIERVKQLLLYEGLTVTEIAHKLRYCSAAHLCVQFKKVTGRTPSQFKRDNRERPFAVASN